VNAVDTRTRLDAFGGNIAAPVKSQLNLGLAVIGRRAHAVHAAQCRQRFFNRTRNASFDFFRGGAGVGHLNKNAGKFDVRKFLQRQQLGGNKADQTGSQKDHDRRNRAAQCQAGVAHD